MPQAHAVALLMRSSTATSLSASDVDARCTTQRVGDGCVTEAMRFPWPAAPGGGTPAKEIPVVARWVNRVRAALDERTIEVNAGWLHNIGGEAFAVVPGWIVPTNSPQRYSYTLPSGGTHGSSVGRSPTRCTTPRSDEIFPVFRNASRSRSDTSTDPKLVMPILRF